MTSTSTPHRLNTVGKRLISVVLTVLLACVLVSIALQPASTSAQEPEVTPTPAATLSDDVAAQAKKDATATPVSTRQATSTPVSVWRQHRRRWAN